MRSIKEMKTFVFEVFSWDPNVYCKAFEDNFGSIYIARLPKICPHTKDNSVLSNYFREYVRKVLIHIQQFSINEQYDDTWTKLLPHNVFLKHRKIIFGA